MNPLAARLRERIAASGPISFSVFMESALYDERDGFYARGPRLGAGGAFTTAPIASPFLARALATDLRDLWERLGRPQPFTLVEVGPGDGSLAAGLAAELSDLPLDLVLCERATGMLEQARARVPGARAAELAQLAGIRGAIVANEVHDACPAHRLRWPRELLVDVGPDGRFALVPGPPAGELGDPVRAAGARPVEGAEYEVSPAQAALQSTLARALERGALIVLDYGEAGAARYDRPVPRLRTYLSGMAGGDPLAAPGHAGHHGRRRLRRRAPCRRSRGAAHDARCRPAGLAARAWRAGGDRAAAAPRRRAALARGTLRSRGNRRGVPGTRPGARLTSLRRGLRLNGTVIA